ncbi:PA2169 family four-helix-bundle protein [Pacificimonas sp. ICDLI1SI03]
MNTVLTTLNTLTDTAVDSIKGYELAAQRATNPGLKSTFSSQAEKRRATVNTLNKEIVRLGGEPRDPDGTMLGDLHRIWTKITDRFSDSDKAATDNVEEGEDYIKDKFAAAIDGGLLNDDPQALGAIKTAFAEIAEGEKLTDMLEQRYERAA